MALTLANRTIPSSCLSLITLSPRPGGALPPAMQQRFLTPVLTNFFQPLEKFNSQLQLVILLGPVLLCNFSDCVFLRNV
jgi:hypothetical protein